MSEPDSEKGNKFKPNCNYAETTKGGKCLNKSPVLLLISLKHEKNLKVKAQSLIKENGSLCLVDLRLVGGFD